MPKKVVQSQESLAAIKNPKSHCIYIAAILTGDRRESLLSFASFCVFFLRPGDIAVGVHSWIRSEDTSLIPKEARGAVDATS